MKQKSKKVLTVAVIGVLMAVLLVTAIMHIASGQYSYQNYWGGLVFAPFVILFEVFLIAALVKISDRRKRKEMKRDNELFEGPLKDWRKW
jgi:Ni/Fe-hydrogenase subunit HybB-like protein